MAFGTAEFRRRRASHWATSPVRWDRRSRLADEHGKKKQAGEVLAASRKVQHYCTCAWVVVRAACPQQHSSQSMGRGRGGVW